MYAYSENLGEALQRSAQKKKPKSALNIVSPPLDKSNFLLTYTDAVVVNKSKFADTKRAELIVKFVKFYTSLKFRENFSFGQRLSRVTFFPLVTIFSPKQKQPMINTTRCFAMP